MDNLKARVYFSEFMTRRWDDGLDAFTDDIFLKLNQGSEVLIVMDDVKFMSISFFDEVFRRLSKKGLSATHFKLLHFSSTLEPAYQEHLEQLTKLLE